MLRPITAVMLNPSSFTQASAIYRRQVLCEISKRMQHTETDHEDPKRRLNSGYPVIIAGAGPSGLTLSLWLSRYGVKNVVLDKAKGPTQHPQAHYINNRTMEVFRPLLGLASEVASSSPPLNTWRTFRYGASMTGELFGEVDHFPGQASPHMKSVSPQPVTHLPQNRLLPLLIKRATSSGNSRLTTVLWDHAVNNCQVTDDGVSVAVTDGAGNTKQLHGSFLVAADGAHSIIRNQLGIGMAGQEAMQHLINIHFTCPSLGQKMMEPVSTHHDNNASRLPQPLTKLWRSEPASTGTGSKTRAAMLYFVFNPGVVAVVVAHDLVQGEFVMQVPYLPPLQSPADFPQERCRQLISAAAGLPASQLPDLKVHQARPWIMSATVADRYHHPGHTADTSSSNSNVPRIFLIGDAAHRFPPAGGFGMNTGVQDAHNLAWKLALAMKHGDGGFLRPSHLLRSYQIERLPVAAANSNLSCSNWQEAVAIPSQMGLDPRAADMLSWAMQAAPLPAPARKLALEAGLTVGRALTTPWSPLRPYQMSKIQERFRSGGTLRLQFPKEDLGFHYPPGHGAAVAPDPCLTHPSSQSQKQNTSTTAATNGQITAGTNGRDQPYVPCSAPGHRLPHVWLAPLQSHHHQPCVPHSSVSTQTADVSTLDVIVTAAAGMDHTLSADKEEQLSGVRNNRNIPVGPHFTLFVDDHPTWSQAWLRALTQVQQQSVDVPVIAIQIVQKHAQAVHKAVHTAESAREAVDVQRHDSDSINAAASTEVDCLQYADVESKWHDVLGAQQGSVLLVRPDGHVAWRCQPSDGNAGDAATCFDLLYKAMATVLRGA